MAKKWMGYERKIDEKGCYFFVDKWEDDVVAEVPVAKKEEKSIFKKK